MTPPSMNYPPPLISNSATAAAAMTHSYIICYSCGEIGHISKSCPARWASRKKQGPTRQSKPIALVGGLPPNRPRGSAVGVSHDINVSASNSLNSTKNNSLEVPISQEQTLKHKANATSRLSPRKDANYAINPLYNRNRNTLHESQS